MTMLVKQNQQIFRNLVEALSYPGKLVQVKVEDTYKGKLLPVTMGVLFALLDGEVTYQIIGDDKESNEEVQFRVSAIAAGSDVADYIIIPLLEHNQISKVINQAKKGDLLDPNQNATIIIECESFDGSDIYSWSGPGIKDTKQVALASSKEWLDSRQNANNDFPLGIDIILVNKNAEIIGLPRTTTVKGVN